MNRFKLSWLLGAVALLGWMPSQTHAQQWFSIEGRGGVAFPMGDLAELENAGGTFGGGLALRVHPRIALRADFDALFLEGERPSSGVVLPGINLFHTVAGVEVSLTREVGPDAPFTLTGNLGAGTTRFEIEAFVTPEGQTFVLRERYFTTNGGVRLAYALSRNISLVLGGQGYLTFVDEEDLAVLEPLDIERFDTAWSFPITAGVRIGL